MKKIYKYTGLLVIAFALTKCDLNVIPQDALTSEQIAYMPFLKSRAATIAISASIIR
jgi:hypothetical protein